jgi:hypothetical protein
MHKMSQISHVRPQAQQMVFVDFSLLQVHQELKTPVPTKRWWTLPSKPAELQ